jgi:putative oxidoreductase
VNAREITWNLLRIVGAFLFMQHGLQKLFGLLGGMGPEGGRAAALTLMWFAGVIEFGGGLLLLLGLLTRPVAFLASGEMAVAYFRSHAPDGFWPIQNRGELAALYCFLWLFFAAHGPGSFSLDRLLARRSMTSRTPAEGLRRG